MRVVLKLLSFVALGLTVIPAFLVFAQAITWNAYLTMTTIGTLLWFLTSPFWITKETQHRLPSPQSQMRFPMS